MSDTSHGRAIFAGLCASLVGIGLARFAYTPLLPALIEAHWFAASDVIFLGAANLAGYLAGAVGGRPLASRLGARRTLQWMMLLASLAFFGCAVPVSVSWFFVWRFLSGLSGGAIMVLAAPSILPYVAPARRGAASGAIFLGLGLGIAGSGTLVPLLLKLGLWQTWAGLGLLSATLTAATWTAWPGAAAPAPAAPGAKRAVAENPPAPRMLYVQYALVAVGLVPTMVFLVDFIARGLGFGAAAAARFWVVYGLGAIAGPVVYGRMTDRLGALPTNAITSTVQVGAIALLCAAHSHAALLAATFVIGTFPPGIVPVYLGAIRQALPGNVPAQNAVWSRATTVFALTQAMAGYGSSWLLNASGGQHRILFVLSAGALVLTVLLGQAARLLPARQTGA